MQKIVKLTRKERYDIIRDVSTSYENFAKYKELANKEKVAIDYLKIYTSYNKIKRELHNLTSLLGDRYRVRINERKVELILLNDAQKVSITKTFIKYKKSVENKSTITAPTNAIEDELNKVSLKYMYTITRVYLFKLNSLLESLEINVSVLNIEYYKDALVINVRQKIDPTANSKISGSLIHKYTFDTNVKHLTVDNKTDSEIKAMVYLSLGIIIS